MVTQCRTRVDVRAVAWFVGVVLGLGWLISLPLWFDERGLRSPGAGFVLLAMMAAPTLATLLMVRVVRPVSDLTYLTGLRARGGVRSWLGWGVLAWLGPPVLVVLSLLLSAAVGSYHPDLGFSGLRELVMARSGHELAIPASTLAAIQVVQVVLLGWLNLLPALAEEWGWRGWLLPQLLPLGRWPAVVLVGVVWGLWHTPIILLGYNYPEQPPPVRVLLMVVFCVVAGSLLGWLRLRSGSVWPSAIGHGFINAAAGLPLVFAAAGTSIDNASVGLLGWPGWAVMTPALALLGAFARRATSRIASETSEANRRS